MLAIPDQDYSRPEVLASWLELGVFVSDGPVTIGETLGTLRDSGLFGEEGIEPRARGGEDLASTAAQAAWQCLQRRAAVVGSSWPIHIERDKLYRRGQGTTLAPVVAYLSLLLLEASGYRWYKSLPVIPEPRIRTLFETIVVASFGKLMGGTALRFGAPFPADWPKGFERRVKRLADVLQLPVRPLDLKALSTPRQQDDTLDAVCRLKVADEDAGLPYFLLQCATGANWFTSKNAEPQMDVWRRYIAWNGPTYKALAVPFTLRENDMLFRASIRHGNALILDRLRICAGAPDIALDDCTRLELLQWVNIQMRALRRTSTIR